MSLYKKKTPDESAQIITLLQELSGICSDSLSRFDSRQSTPLAISRHSSSRYSLPRLIAHRFGLCIRFHRHERDRIQAALIPWLAPMPAPGSPAPQQANDCWVALEIAKTPGETANRDGQRFINREWQGPVYKPLPDG